MRLQVDGHHVLAAVDAASAIALARTAVKLDLAAVNVLSVDPAALRVLDELRADEATRDLPVVTYLAYASTVAVQGLSLGDTDAAQGQPLLRLLSVMNSLNQPAYAPAE